MKTLLKFAFKRGLAALPLLFFLPFITLCLMHAIPGNYFDSLRMNPQISAETIAQYEKNYHLGAPLILQYGYWLKNLLRLDLGFSFAYQQPVLSVLKSRAWNTFLLSGASILFAWGIALPLGLLAAIKRNRWQDRILRGVSYLGLSFPNFFLCLLFLYLAYRTGGLPLSGMRSVHYDALTWAGKVTDIAQHMIIPVLILGGGSACHLFRLMRAQTVEVLDKDFVLQLEASRIPRRTILFRHVLRNAVNPLVTLFGMELPALFSGAALVEIFTGWPGLGQVMLSAVRSQDLFLVLGNMLVISFLLICGNLISDVLLIGIDPRIRAWNPPGRSTS
ncbi:MAG TPA: ABC transporter permease [Candidatus Omnitrophota bacterium]|nr:ABC transporter permease [Candidatus Omnitrophota bacterium]